MSKILTDKRENGKWRYRFAVANINGKRQYHSKSGFNTQREAYAAGVKKKQSMIILVIFLLHLKCLLQTILITGLISM